MQKKQTKCNTNQYKTILMINIETIYIHLWSFLQKSYCSNNWALKNLSPCIRINKKNQLSQNAGISVNRTKFNQLNLNLSGIDKSYIARKSSWIKEQMWKKIKYNLETSTSLWFIDDEFGKFEISGYIEKLNSSSSQYNMERIRYLLVQDRYIGLHFWLENKQSIN